jgi:hypothetical protein
MFLSALSSFQLIHLKKIKNSVLHAFINFFLIKKVFDHVDKRLKHCANVFFTFILLNPALFLLHAINGD